MRIVKQLHLSHRKETDVVTDLTKFMFQKFGEYYEMVGVV